MSADGGITLLEGEQAPEAPTELDLVDKRPKRSDLRKEDRVDDEKSERKTSRSPSDSDELPLTYPLLEYGSFGHAGGRHA